MTVDRAGVLANFTNDATTPEARVWLERVIELRNDGDPHRQEVFAVRCCGVDVEFLGLKGQCGECGFTVSARDLMCAHGLESLATAPTKVVEPGDIRV